eukprot:SAG31_NODE_2129_length_6388_cov_3.199396_8_plen_110_part_00
MVPGDSAVHALAEVANHAVPGRWDWDHQLPICLAVPLGPRRAGATVCGGQRSDCCVLVRCGRVPDWPGNDGWATFIGSLTGLPIGPVRRVHHQGGNALVRDNRARASTT